MDVYGSLSPIQQVATAMVQPCIATEEIVRPVPLQHVQQDTQQRILDVVQLQPHVLEVIVMVEHVVVVQEPVGYIPTQSLTMLTEELAHQQVESYVEEVLQLRLLVLERITILQGSLKQQGLVP
jgi:hypothetical protein